MTSDEQLQVIVGVLRLVADYSGKYLKYQCIDSRAILETTGSILQNAVIHFGTFDSNVPGVICDMSMAILAICKHILASVQDSALIGVTVRIYCSGKIFGGNALNKGGIFLSLSMLTVPDLSEPLFPTEAYRLRHTSLACVPDFHKSACGQAQRGCSCRF